MATTGRIGNAFVDYYDWRDGVEVVGDYEVAIVAKPGCTGFGRHDEANILLGEAITRDDAVDVLVLNDRHGIVGAAAALGHTRRSIIVTSSNLVDVEAARRTLVANRVTNAVVCHSFGTEQLATAPLVDVVALRIPTGRLPLLRQLRQAYLALRVGGRLYLAGANDEGIKSALDRAKRSWGSVDVLTYRGGARVGVATKLDDRPLTDLELADPILQPGAFHRFDDELCGQPLTVYTRPGISSWDRLDPGTRLLAESVRIDRGERVLDLGCGYGALGVIAARRVGPTRVTIVDVDIDSLDAARATLAANGMPDVEVMASDSVLALANRRFDVVITNPPFHLGRDTEYDVTRQFIRDAASVLTRAGRLCLVANRFLPYEATMRESFGSVETIVEDERYKVLVGRGPRPGS